MDAIKAKELIEESLNELSSTSRAFWEKKDINRVIDNLIELWGMVNSEINVN